MAASFHLLPSRKFSWGWRTRPEDSGGLVRDFLATLGAGEATKLGSRRGGSPGNFSGLEGQPVGFRREGPWVIFNFDGRPWGAARGGSHDFDRGWAVGSWGISRREMGRDCDHGSLLGLAFWGWGVALNECLNSGAEHGDWLSLGGAASAGLAGRGAGGGMGESPCSAGLGYVF